jgi:hypothetical protein
MHAAQFFAEARYTYTWGPTINPPSGSSYSSTTSNMAYFPLIFGVRF